MNRRVGFTLIELLVVAGIFASLFGLMLTVARPNQTTAIRRAAAELVSVLVATQSKALRNPVGAGVILDSAGDAAMVAAVTSADMLPFITGACTATPLTNRNVTSTAVNVSPDNAAAGDLANGYKIQFWRVAPAQPVSPWFRFESGNTVRFRDEIGQALQNTIWPEPFASGSACNVLIARYPNEGETLLDLPKNVAIDLRFSGVGDGTNAWNGLAGKSAIGITYDSLGGLDAVMQSLGTGNATATHPLAPLYLLVAPRDTVLAGTALGSERALWVVVHPQTGRVSVSSNVPQTGTDAAAVRAARAKARAQAAIGK